MDESAERKDGVLDAAWAIKAVQRIEEAMEGWNSTMPSKMRVAWGQRDAEEEAEEAECPESLQEQAGLLNWSGADFVLSIRKNGDPDHPNYCTVSLSFKEDYQVPLDAKSLYNLLRVCEENVTLWVIPNEGSIALVGVRTMIPVSSIKTKTFRDVLSRLKLSATQIAGQFAGEGDDWWEMEGGEADSDDGED